MNWKEIRTYVHNKREYKKIKKSFPDILLILGFILFLEAERQTSGWHVMKYFELICLKSECIKISSWWIHPMNYKSLVNTRLKFWWYSIFTGIDFKINYLSNTYWIEVNTPVEYWGLIFQVLCLLCRIDYFQIDIGQIDFQK